MLRVCLFNGLVNYIQDPVGIISALDSEYRIIVVLLLKSVMQYKAFINLAYGLVCKKILACVGNFNRYQVNSNNIIIEKYDMLPPP